MKKPILGWEFGSKDFPRRLAYTLFFAGCNLKCSFCHNPEVANAKDGAYSLQELADFIVYGRGHSVPDVGVVFSGGEPSVSPYFENAIQLFNCYPLAIHTNGLRLPERKRNPFEAVVLSIKPISNEINQYTEKMLAAVDYYRTAKFKEIRIVATDDMEKAIQTVDAMKNCLDAYGVNDWVVNVVNERRRAQ